jgi:hypothetical protein
MIARRSRLKWSHVDPAPLDPHTTARVRILKDEVAWVTGDPCMDGKWLREKRIPLATFTADRGNVAGQWWTVLNASYWAHYKTGPQLCAWNLVRHIRRMLDLPEPDPAVLVRLSAQNERTSTYNGKPQTWGVITLDEIAASA